MLAGTLCPPVPAAHRVGAVHISLYIIPFFLPYCKKSRRFWGPTLQKRSETAGWFAAGHPSGKLRAPDHAAILFMQPYAPEINPVEPIGKGLRASGFCNDILASRKKGLTVCARQSTALLWKLLSVSPGAMTPKDLLQSSGLGRQATGFPAFRRGCSRHPAGCAKHSMRFCSGTEHLPGHAAVDAAVRAGFCPLTCPRCPSRRYCRWPCQTAPAGCRSWTGAPAYPPGNRRCQRPRW